jgi:adenine-specific DNA-methyltransferase
MSLTDREKEQIKAMIDAGEPLPPRFKAVLFDHPHEAELIWPGKTAEVTNVVLPFQSIEQIDEPRSEQGKHVADLFSLNSATGRQTGGWTNKLIWGDNKLVLSSLKNGPLRRTIEEAGGLKLVYIDPPFDVGADFSVDIEIGNESLTKEPSVIEEIAYRDTWGRGADSYIAMIYERLSLIRDLMHADASVYVHCDGRVNSHIRLVMDELFGADGYANEVTWKRTGARSGSAQYNIIADRILFYKRGEPTWNVQYTPYTDKYVEDFFRYVDEKGSRYRLTILTAPGVRQGSSGMAWRGYNPTTRGRHWAIPKYIRPQLSDPNTTDSQAALEELEKIGRIFWPKKDGGGPSFKQYQHEMEGVELQDIWTDIGPVSSQANERLNYDTQKPEALLERIVAASTLPGDMVADFFCGSGTTLAVAEKMGRKWIGADLGRFAIHTSRKRLIAVQRELKATAKPYRSFEILNLGKYERQFFVGIDPTLPEEQRRAISAQKEEHYLTLILSAYKAERNFQTPPFHGRRGGALVVVGPIDAPVTQAQVAEAVEAARRLRVNRVDVIGFEFEMGLVPHAIDQARAKGINLALRYIPKDVFDRRAVEKGQVVFYDVAFVEAKPSVKGRSVTVKLTDFGVYYRQEDVASLVADMKPGGSKVAVENGQVVKIAKDKKGIIKRERLTKSWTDWIDYWAVDFDFENRKEVVRVTEPDGTELEAWTGGYIFENEWQSFRTRKDRTLELASAPHEYPTKGRYKIAVKVIDIFGNDTTKVVEVRL